MIVMVVQCVRMYGGSGSGGCDAAFADATTAMIETSCMQTHVGITANPNSNDDDQKIMGVKKK